MNRLFLYILVLLGCASCFKEASYNTNYILQPYEQLESGGERVPLAGVKAFVFAGNTEDWYVASYDDAVAGVITSLKSGEQRGPIAEAEPYNGSETELSLQLQRVEVIIVAVDPAAKVYAYTSYEVPQNLENVYVTAMFYRWKDASYTAGSWTYVLPEVVDPQIDDSDVEVTE